jgi:hypothetical protein
MTSSMTSVFSMTPARWRVLLLCVAVLLLHLFTIDWLGQHIGAGQDAQYKPDKPQVISAALLKALMAPDPEDAAPLPKPAAKPVPKAAPVRQGRPASNAAQAAALAALGSDDDTPGASDAQIAAAAAADGADFPGAGAAKPAPPVEAPKPAAEPPPKPVPEAPKPGDDAPFVPHRYRTVMPDPAQFDLDLKRVDADGTKWDGVADMRWSTDGSHYKVRVEAGVSILVTRVNLLVSTSEGIIDDAGIAPVTATEKRKGRAQTATHFNRDTKLITFSATERNYPLPEGAQDKASLPFQLAAIGRADVNQFVGNIDLFVGEDKEANLFRFHLVGEDEITTPMGRLVTWHLTRPPRPGSYSSRLDIWLAPSLGWYPVQIRNTEASGALTTQIVTAIHRDKTAADKSSAARPPAAAGADSTASTAAASTAAASTAASGASADDKPAVDKPAADSPTDVAKPADPEH